MNVPTEVAFKFDTPMEKEGQYGPYDIWTVEMGDEEHVLFASGDLRDLLRAAEIDRGTVLTLLKEERKDGKKGYDFVVSTLDGYIVKADEESGQESEPEPKTEPKKEASKESAGRKPAERPDPKVAGKEMQVNFLNCLRTVMVSTEQALSEKPGVLVEGFSSEDIRTMTNCLFIEVNRNKVTISKPKATDELMRKSERERMGTDA